MPSRIIITILSLVVLCGPVFSQKQVSIDRTKLAQDRSKKESKRKKAVRREKMAVVAAPPQNYSEPRKESKPAVIKSASYLRINGQYSDYVSTKVAHFSNTRVFSVDTDGKTWVISHVPSWCSITSRTSYTFTVAINDNYSCSSRNDWLTVQCDNRYVRVNINQEGKPYNVVASVNDVNIEHNTFVNGTECMAVSGSFHIKNGKGLTFYAVATMMNEYGNFVYADGRYPTYKMKDGTFYATDKTQPYASDIHHFKLYIPNRSFLPGYKKKNKWKLVIVLYCDNKGEYVQGVSRIIPIVVTRKKGITRTKN